LQEIQNVPVFVDEISGQQINQVACGADHTVVLSQGTVISFGSNSVGQLGVVAGTNDFGLLHKIPLLVNITKIATGANHTLCTSSEGQVFSWGDNSKGQLGLGSKDSTCSTPTLLSGMHSKNIACGAEHSMVICEKGHLYAFGDNSLGQLGIGLTEPFVSCPMMSNIVDYQTSSIHSIWCGSFHSLVQVLAYKEKESFFEKQYFAFGDNKHGQLGLGDCENRKLAEKVCFLESCDVLDVSLGYNTSYVWINNRGLYACGLNDSGQLGTKDPVLSNSVFEKVQGIPMTMKGVVTASSFVVVIPQTEPINIPQIPYNFEKLKPKITLQSCVQVEHASALQKDEKLKPKQIAQACVLVEHPSSLLKDMGELLESGIFCDVILKGNKSISVESKATRPKEFPVHSAILSCRAPLIHQIVHQEMGKFKDTSRMLSLSKHSGWKLKNRAVSIDLQVSQLALEIIVQFVYTDDIESAIAKLTPEQLLDLSWGAKSYGIERLLALCQRRTLSVLDVSNAVLVYGRATQLGLFATKRICLEFIFENYQAAVSTRNRPAVDTLHDMPALLAEIVGVSSPDFAKNLINSLPTSLEVQPSSLVRDLARMRSEAGAYLNVDLMPFNSQCQETVGVPCHAFILASRCPVIRQAFESYFGNISTVHKRKPEKEDQTNSHSADSENNSISELCKSTEESGLQELLLQGTTLLVNRIVTGTLDGRLKLREISEASLKSIHVFLNYLYCDATSDITADVAIDLLMMAHVYGMTNCSLCSYCETILVDNLAPESAVDIICASKVLGLTALENRAIEYFASHFHECLQHKEILIDALEDFPDLGMKLLGCMDELTFQHLKN